MADEIFELIGAIYDSALESGAWPELLTRIADLAGAENAALIVIDPRIGLSSVLTPRADPSVVDEYNSHWWKHDPTAQATVRQAPGLITDLSHTGRDAYFASAFQNEFWAKSGLGAERLASNLFTDGTAFGSFILQASRARDEITSDMAQTFRLILPHVLRSVTIQKRLHHILAALVATGHPNAEGMMLVDPSGRLIWADAEARAHLAERGAFRISGGRLELSDAAATHRLEAAVRACAQSGTSGVRRVEVFLSCPLSGASLVVEVLRNNALADAPFPLVDDSAAATALILVHHHQRRAERRREALKERYGLTRAEARLALEIAKGDGRAAAAARAGISVNTARTHLVSIFSKMGVQRQSELIRRITET
jgi:DNA-binding CsgD family transcriptional regulator